MKTFITGDIHGDITRIKNIEKFCISNETSENDCIILLGDVGINYHGDFRDKIRKELMSKIPITFVCIRGNHEMRPEKIHTYQEKPFFDDIVYYEPEYSNILFLKDGHNYTIGEHNYFVLGGAYSVDKFYRLEKGYNWFSDEQLDEKERNSIDNFLTTNNNFDIILSHTCPDEWQPTELFLSYIDQSKVDKTIEKWLSQVKSKIKYNKWYFGHFHGEKINNEDNFEMLYREIREID